MAQFPALMLWTDAWIADTKHLTRLERGTYHDLLVLMWRTPGCSVPNDDGWLGKRLEMTQLEVETELRPIIEEFCATDGNRIWQKRLLKEWKWVDKKTREQSDRAKRRWEKEKKNTDAYAAARTVAYAPTPTPTPLEESPSDSSPTTQPKRERKASAYPADFETWYDVYPLHVGKGAAHKAWLRATKGGKATNDELIAGATRYRDDPNRDPSYTKHPATWLNAGCHSDCALPLRGGSHNGNGRSVLDACDRIGEAFGASDYVPGSSGPQPRELDHKVRPPGLKLIPKG